MDKTYFEKADLSLLPEDGQVIIGFSGGADSMALTHFISRKIDRGRILCVHVNHMLRGDEANKDEAACEEFCRENGLRFAAYKEDVTGYAKEKGIGFEEAGREVRYRLFRSQIRGENDRILTAHNADDNAETVLMNLIRGTGLDGLCGIPKSRGSILRPLLAVSRQEIEEYCVLHELAYVTDSSNLSEHYRRNRIRLSVMTVIKDMNPGFIEGISGMTNRLNRDREFIVDCGEALAKSSRAGRNSLRAQPLRDSPESVRIAALKSFFKDCGCRGFSSVHLEYAASHLENGDNLTLPGGKEMAVSAGLITVEDKQKELSWSMMLTEGANTLPDGRVLYLKEINAADNADGNMETHRKSQVESAKVNNLLFKFFLDCDTISSNLTARNRLPGDKFEPVGRGVRKSLKQLFMEKGIPRGQRDGKFILESGGKILFVEGFGPSQSAAVNKESKKILMVEYVTNLEDGI